ncbi:MAG: GDSL-type esterase/lipase family protein [Bdellovibrionales bacterium]
MSFVRMLFVNLLLLTSINFAEANVIRILPLGDSLTAGGCNENGQWKVGGGYRLHLQQLLKMDVRYFDIVGSQMDGPVGSDRDHEGRSGWGIVQLSTIVDETIRKYNPEIVLLMIGSNDMIKNQEIEMAPRRLLELVRKLFAAKSYMRVIVSSVLTTDNFLFNQRIIFYNESIEQLIKQEMKTNPNLFWFDGYKESDIQAHRIDLIDGVHPSAIGYEKLGRAWYKAVSPLFKSWPQ